MVQNINQVDDLKTHQAFDHPFQIIHAAQFHGLTKQTRLLSATGLFTKYLAYSIVTCMY
jgi:hypothetical protein